ncbi:MAG: efflux RND transporter permease subunit, partial [Bdellovibrio sp.]
MGEIYKSPLRVYLLLGLLGLWGVLSGLSLPVSLFPNSSKPVIQAEVPYGDLTAEEFSKTYGNIIETQLKGLLIDGRTVENLEAHYTAKEAEYKIEFQWETNGDRALREVQTLMAALSASWPEDSRLSYQVESWQENGGFLALSFYSPLRSLDDLYEELRPIMDPIGARVPDASSVGLFNPNRKHVEIIADPERLASLNLLPSDIENAVRSSNSSLTGGRLLIGEKQVAVEIPRDLSGIEGLNNLPIYTRSGVRLRLQDVATIQVVTNTKTFRQFKTSGVPSLILFANPKPGGNIKKMSDDIMSEVARLKNQLPADVEFKVLVNPSEFINSSIKSVTKEVALAAGLAVIILLIFIGSLKNVITAAVEIPLSIIMAFIFMKLFDMNLNLISLGGLALSAGMNVDASVVVMENIFRHFDKAGSNLSADDRLKTVIRAVKEVWGPILASTVASLVVFVPLIMTSGLTNSILGDLAKAVIFSHAMSAVVALVLVPTVRLQMMKTETNFHLHSPIEKQFTWLENAYAKALDYFIRTDVLRWTTYAALVGVLAVLLIVVLPKLPKEIIGRPETDWVILGVSKPTFTEPRQLDQYTEKLEYYLLQKYNEETAYTFTQLNVPKKGMIMISLK